MTKVGQTELRIMLWQQLDTADEDLLLSLLALARPIHHTEEVHKDTTGTEHEYLWRELKVKDMPDASSIAINTTRGELLTYMQKRTGQAAYKALIESMRRLAGVNIEFKSVRGRGSFHLLSWVELPDGTLKVAIDPLTASLLLGEKNVSYTRIDLSERFGLPKGICRRLHTIINCSSDRNGQGKMNLYNLAAKIWNKDVKQIDRALARELKKRLLKLNGLNSWSIHYVGRGNKCIVSWSKPVVKRLV